MIFIYSFFHVMSAQYKSGSLMGSSVVDTSYATQWVISNETKENYNKGFISQMVKLLTIESLCVWNVAYLRGASDDIDSL